MHHLSLPGRISTGGGLHIAAGRSTDGATHSTEHMTSNGVGQALRAGRRRASTPDFFPHSFRRTVTGASSTPL